MAARHTSSSNSKRDAPAYHSVLPAPVPLVLDSAMVHKLADAAAGAASSGAEEWQRSRRSDPEEDLRVPERTKGTWAAAQGRKR